MTNYVIRNQTMDELVLASGSNVLRLPPLRVTRVGEDPAKALGRAARAAAQDNVVVWEPEPIRSSRLLLITWCAALGIPRFLRRSRAPLSAQRTSGRSSAGTMATGVRGNGGPSRTA